MSHASSTSGLPIRMRTKPPLKVTFADECCNSELEPEQIDIEYTHYPSCSKYYQFPSNVNHDSEPQTVYDLSSFKKCKHGSKCVNSECIFVHDETALTDPELTLRFALKCQRAAAMNYQKLAVEKTKSTKLERDLEWYKRELNRLNHLLYAANGGRRV